MTMEEDTSLIAEYFRIPSVISSMKNHIERANEAFWERSFISSPMNIDVTGYRQSGRPFTMLVDDLVAFEEYMNERIEMLKYQQQRFTQYLTSLNNDDLKTLKSKYLFNRRTYVDENLEITVLGECLLINAEVKKRFNDLDSMLSDVSHDYMSSLNDILEMLV